MDIFVAAGYKKSTGEKGDRISLNFSRNLAEIALAQVHQPVVC